MTAMSQVCWCHVPHMVEKWQPGALLCVIERVRDRRVILICVLQYISWPTRLFLIFEVQTKDLSFFKIENMSSALHCSFSSPKFPFAGVTMCQSRICLDHVSCWFISICVALCLLHCTLISLKASECSGFYPWSAAGSLLCQWKCYSTTCEHVGGDHGGCLCFCLSSFFSSPEFWVRWIFWSSVSPSGQTTSVNRTRHYRSSSKPVFCW